MFAFEGQVLDIIVENQGRIAYGAMMNDNRKVHWLIYQRQKFLSTLNIIFVDS